MKKGLESLTFVAVVAASAAYVVGLYAVVLQ
jgi:hypothetical protein